MNMSGINKEDAVKRSGDMLIGGWKMLNTSCPICYTPIMSKAGRFHCPGCDIPVMTEAEAAFMAKENARTATQSGPVYPMEEVEVKSLEEEKKAYDLKRGKANMISGKIGEHLLLGYTLLGQECPRDTCCGIPLMQKKGENPYCVNCHNLFVQDSYGAFVPEAHLKPKSIASPSKSESLTDKLAMFREKERAAAAAEDAPIVDLAKSSTKTDPSRLIGERLLQGWALMEQTCPMCENIPLMQDRKKELYCVVCGFINQKKTEPHKVDRIIPPVSAVSDAMDHDSANDDELENMLDSDVIATYNQSRLRSLQRKSSKRCESVQASSTGGSDVIARLQQKIGWAVDELDCCTDVQKCIDLSRLVSELSSAICTLRKNL